MPGIGYEVLIDVAKAGWNGKVKRRLEVIGERMKRTSHFRKMIINAGLDWDGTDSSDRVTVAVSGMTRHGADSDPWSGMILSDGIRATLDMLLLEWRKASALAAEGLTPRNRILLHGLPGNGKSTIARLLANALRFPISEPGPAEVFNSQFGESAQKAAELFRAASRQPTALVLDEIDVLTPARGSDRSCGEPDRIVNAILVEMDRFNKESLLVATTNRLEELDPAIRRRFDLVIELPKPDGKQHAEWFKRFEKEFGKVDAGQELKIAIWAASFSTLSAAWNQCLRSRIVAPETFNAVTVLQSCFGDKLQG